MLGVSGLWISIYVCVCVWILVFKRAGSAWACYSRLIKNVQKVDRPLIVLSSDSLRIRVKYTKKLDRAHEFVFSLNRVRRQDKTVLHRPLRYRS